MSSYLNLPVSWLWFVPYFWYKIGTKQRKQSHRLLAQVTRRRRKRPVHTIACDCRIKPSSLTCDSGTSKGWTSAGKRNRNGINPFCQRMCPALTAKSPSPLNLGELHPDGHEGIRMSILFSHRTLQKEIIDVDCNGLCQVRFGNTFSWTLKRPYCIISITVQRKIGSGILW